MKHFRHQLANSFLIIFALAIAGCASQKSKESDAQLDALLWSTASAEYEVIARQIFFQATRQLDRLLGQGKETALPAQQGGTYSRLPPAVIVDVDETMLANGVFYYQLLSSGKSFNEDDWTAWVMESKSKPVPGALEYVRHAAEKGVTVFYVSNRHISLFEPTYRNLKQTGFPIDSSKNQLLMREKAGRQDDEGANSMEMVDNGWDKSQRRAMIAKDYRIVQIVGDGLGDFMGDTAKMTPAQRREASSAYIAYWGEKWFMLPNPVYGDWESAILNTAGDSTGHRADPTQAKYRFIRGGESQGVW